MGKLAIKAWDATKGAITSFFSSNPTAAARLLKRVGAPSGGIGSVLAAAKQNPVTAAFIALEAGQAGYALIEALREEYPDMMHQLEQISHVADEVTEDTPISDISKFSDELAMLDDLSAQVGGDARMYNLINCVKMAINNPAILKLREQVQAIRR
jgi:hypothetical protein